MISPKGVLVSNRIWRENPIDFLNPIIYKHKYIISINVQLADYPLVLT